MFARWQYRRKCVVFKQQQMPPWDYILKTHNKLILGFVDFFKHLLICLTSENIK